MSHPLTKLELTMDTLLTLNAAILIILLTTKRVDTASDAIEYIALTIVAMIDIWSIFN